MYTHLIQVREASSASEKRSVGKSTPGCQHRTYSTWKYTGQLGPHCKAMLKCCPQVLAQRTKRRAKGKDTNLQLQRPRDLLCPFRTKADRAPAGQFGAADPLSSVSILQAALLRAQVHAWRAEQRFHTWSSLVLVSIPESTTAAPPTRPGPRSGYLMHSLWKLLDVTPHV